MSQIENVKNYLQMLITLLVLISCGVYLYANRSQLLILKDIQLFEIVLISSMMLAFFGISGYTFKLLVNLMNVQLSIIEMIGLTILTNFGNYLGPTRPGAALKAIYLKSTKGLAYTGFASVVAANIFLGLFMMGIVGTALLLGMRMNTVSVPPSLVFVCVGLILGSLAPFFFNIPRIKIQGRIAHLLQLALEGFIIIRSQKRKLVFICLTFLLQFGFSALQYQVIFSVLGKPISFLSALAIGVFTSVANLITITPNNIGIQEAVSAYLFTLTGFDFSTGVIGAGLIRVTHMLITFTLTPIFVHILFCKKHLNLPWTRL